METIGYKVNGALGYEVFMNQNGTITIKQKCPIAGEQLVVLNSAEAEILARALDEMQDWCKINSEPILENPDTDEEEK